MTSSRLISIVALLVGISQGAQSAQFSTEGDPLIRSGGGVRVDILVGEKLLVRNPANNDQAMAFVVCRDMQDHPASKPEKHCTVQSYPPEFFGCDFIDGKNHKKTKVPSQGKLVNLKAEYNSTVASKAMTADSPQMGYIYCAKDSEGEAKCNLQKSVPSFMSCHTQSEEAAETDSKTKRPVAPATKKPVAPPGFKDPKDLKNMQDGTY